MRIGQLNKWRRGLRATFPFVGGLRRHAAMTALENHRNDPTVISLLVEASALPDTEIADGARRALADLETQLAIDALCALWAKERHAWLGTIIAQRSYVASTPRQVQVLSALKCGQRIAIDQPDMVPLLLSLLGDDDEVLRTGAERSLKEISPGPVRDAVCEAAMQAPRERVAELCLAMGFRPSDQQRLCLFLFVTRQLDAYFEEDYHFQNLRLQYDRADANIQAHVMNVVRSGDRRCAGFFGAKSKPLAECSETEIKLAMDSWVRHQDWPRLLQACLELPLKYSFAALSPFRDSGWEPEADDVRSVYRQILADSDGQVVPEAKQPNAESPLFEQWLAQGSEGRLPRSSKAELLEGLRTATPPETVGMVAALAAKAGSGDVAAEAVRQSPHWLVRLAGYTTGLSQDLTRESVEDPNYWIKELASAWSVLELWPGRATPADLEALSAAPAEAWTGMLGTARKVLRTIIGHHVTTGTFEELIVEAGEFSGEFVDAGDAELDTGEET